MTDDVKRSFIDGDGSDITPEEANRRLAQIKENGISASTSGMHEYSHYSFADACNTARPKKYLIAGHVQASALHMTYGEPASGKTFLVIDKAATIACEEISTWQGRHVNHGQVVYFAGEASEGVKIRCAGWATERGINPDNVKMTIFDEVFNLDDENDTEHQLEDTISNIEVYAPNPVYVVIDTLHAFMNGDENQAKDTKAFLAVCRKLIQKFGCAVELIHHVGVSNDAKGRARGSSSWRGAMDIETLVQNESSDDSSITCRITQRKHKDGKKCRPFTVRMNEVVLPDMFDEEGNPVTTLVPEKQETIIYLRNDSQPQPQTPRLTPKELFARKTYKEAAIRHGRISLEGNTGASFIDVGLEQWREVCYELSTADNERKKCDEFSYIRKILTNTGRNIILIKKTVDYHDYYRLARNGDKEKDFRDEVFAAVMRRDEQARAAGDVTMRLFETPIDE